MGHCLIGSQVENEFFSETTDVIIRRLVLFLTEAATRGVLWKKVFLEISQNSQENAFGAWGHAWAPTRETIYP